MVWPSRIRIKTKNTECIPCLQHRGREWRADKGQESNWSRRGVEEFTAQDYQNLLKEQDGKCAICKRPDSLGRQLALDHDHKTGKKRGLLCGKCNSVLGYMEDDPALLIAAAQYLLERNGDSN